MPVAIAPVPVAVGTVEVNKVQTPLAFLVTRINIPISVIPFVIAVDPKITVALITPLTTYSSLMSSFPTSSPIAILYPSTVALFNVASFAYNQK